MEQYVFQKKKSWSNTESRDRQNNSSNHFNKRQIGIQNLMY